MNVDAAFERRKAHLERLQRIEQSGHPGFLEASAKGHCTCRQHGDYIGLAGNCPVCEGRSQGSGSWSAEPNRDFDEQLDPVTLEPVNWFERDEPRRRRRRRRAS